jgi:hypothetical protein
MNTLKVLLTELRIPICLVPLLPLTNYGNNRKVLSMSLNPISWLKALKNKFNPPAAEAPKVEAPKTEAPATDAPAATAEAVKPAAPEAPKP